MKTRLIILMAKVGIFLGELAGRGSSFPGKFALKFKKNIGEDFILPDKIIAVTGSSGKTSTSFMIANTLRINGYKVAHNIKGSNLLYGFISLLLKYSNLNGKIMADALVLEVDERYTEQVFKFLKPTHLVICNITRDQPPRHGHFEVVYNTIKNAITEDMHLIINGDDPMLNKMAIDHKGKISYFGLCKNKHSFNTPISNNLDMVYCPLCHHKLKYNFVSFGNVGDFYCTTCDFKRPKLDYQITNINNDLVIINGEYKFYPKNDIIYTYYNNIAAFAVCSILGIEPNNIINVLESNALSQKRFSYFTLNNRHGYILSGKNENAPSYNQSIIYTSKKNTLKTIIFGFEYISKRYPYQDISWLYDIDFELFKNEQVNKFICVGPLAYDIATRIKIAGISSKKILIANKVSDIYDLLESTKGDIYAILNLGTDQHFIDELKNKGIQVE